MFPSERASSSIIAGLSLLAVLVTVEARADYRTDFRNGVRAFNRGRWSEAAESMRKAIAANGRESAERVNISGTMYVSYTPHYYLGVSLGKLGRCGEARPELAISEAAGFLKRAEIAQVKVTRDACPPALSVATESASPPPPIPSPAVATDTNLTVTETRAAPVFEAPSLQPATPPVTSGRTSEADTLSASKRTLQNALDEAQRLIRSRSGATPARAVAPFNQLTAAIGAGSQAMASSSPASVGRASDRLRTAASAYRLALASRPPPPDGLAEAIGAYANGDYGRAVNLLASNDVSDRIYGAQVVLFRAAARYSLYVLSGERDDALRRQVLADIREFRRIEPARVLSARLFNPRFRALVVQTVR